MTAKRYTLWPDRPDILHNAIDAIKRLDKSKPWDIHIAPHRKRRNQPQNERFHATATALANETGYTQDEIKRLVKDELGWHEVVDGPLGKRKRYKSSADMTKVQMSEATEILNRWCIDLGVPIEPQRMGHAD